VGEGSGLGLAMVYGIVKNANGYVHVDSEVNVGTTFDLLFLPSDAFDETIKPDSNAQPLAGEETILIVDDEALVRELGQEILGSYGYQVKLAEDGLEALKIYKADRETIDLVVLDLKMPRLDGLSTYQQLFNLNPQIKVVICSGHDSKKFRSNPVTRHLPRVDKPFMPEILVQTIRETLAC
jgi:CheY-like chemotaxis protein